jgi:membrane protease YdiL (CAAX protease family)
LNEKQAPAPVASWGRLVGFLLIGVGVAALGFLAQHASTGGAGAASGDLAGHAQAIPIYLGAMLMDWVLLYYCWIAVHHRGGSLWELAGGRWKSWKDVATDVAIAVPFFAVWEGVAYGVHWLLQSRALGQGSAKTVDSLLPHSLLEILIWIATSITAGVCEEMAFRGFLQRQLHALSGNIGLAVLGQGAVFGLFHAYQGWKNVVVIGVLGVLYGALAAWRKNLRVNIATHAFTDIWEGWLKFAVLR